MPRILTGGQMRSAVRHALWCGNLLPPASAQAYTPPKLKPGATMYRECRHIKTSGRKCGAAALTGKAYCYFHARYAHGATRVPAAADPSAAPLHSPLHIPLLEDRGAVRLP